MIGRAALNVSAIGMMVALALGQAFAQGESHHTAIGPEIGVFFPTSSKAADRFGSTWWSIGAKTGDNQRLGTQGHIGFDAQFLYQKRGSNHAFLAPVGVSYRHAIGEAANVTPYTGASVDWVISDIRSDQDNVHSRTRGTIGGSIFAGINVGRGLHVQARYLLISPIRDIDMSGVSLVVGYSF